MKKRLIIAIDGYSGTGKSTLARQLAQKLGYLYIDTGAMYRAITLFFIRNGVDENNPKQVLEALNSIQLEFRNVVPIGQQMFLNGENVASEIRETKVTDRVSSVSSIAAIRTFAVAQQRLFGVDSGVVMDGRDIGTTVFPKADFKLFVTASDDIRAERRFEEMKAKGMEVTFQEVKESLVHRDYLDSHREVSPLQKAPDAIVLDNSKMTREEQLDFALRILENLINKTK